MVSEFLLPFGCLNLLSLFEEKQKEVIEKTGLTILEAVELFEYEKKNERYWNRAKLYKQIVSKALPIAKALYLGYSLLFLFDNTTSHSVYANNALCTRGMNKSSGGKQVWLRNCWYEKDNSQIEQLMSYQTITGQWIQKSVQWILEECGFWPCRSLNLECSKPKCFNCEVAANCKICMKGQKCDLYKAPKECSFTNCSKSRKCDACIH